MKAQFKAWESLKKDDTIAIDEFLSNLQFNADGLIPTIAQQHDSKQVLMMAWMNRESLQITLQSKHVCYYSRSRQTLWKKGESSGHIQTLISLSADCDGDTLLLQVDQKGAACHTHREHCFYYDLVDDKAIVTSNPGKLPEDL